MAELIEMKALQMGTEISAGRLTSEELVRAHLDHIAERDDAVGAWAFLDAERAIEEARSRDSESPRSALHGVPVGIKDIIETSDMPTSHGSPIYEGHQPPNDAACVALLRDAGLVALGKTVTTEFAMRNPGHTRNPHDIKRTPGGSSSGSAASVADFQVPLAIGTQTAGSVIRPASYCGVVGFKPTHGRIPRSGVKILSESLDTIGVMTRSVSDAAAFASILEGTPIQQFTEFSTGPRLGFCQTPMWEHAEEGTKQAMREARRLAEAAGASIVDVTLPKDFRDALEAQEIIQAYEAWRSLAFELRFRPEKVSKVLKDYVASGAEHTRERYDWARNIQAVCKAIFWPLFQDLDAMIAPAAPGEASQNLAFTGSPVFNRMWTMLGVPAINVPGLTGPAGMPVGVQAIGPAGRALETLSAAAWLEQAFASA